jgi:hypothetical protein
MKRFLVPPMVYLVFVINIFFTPNSASAIEGGSDAPEANFVVFLETYYEKGNGSCTCALIAPRIVVTAAHCLEPSITSNGSVCVSLNRSSTSECVRKENLFINSTYFPGSTSTEDIGFVLIPAEIFDSSYIEPGIAGDEEDFYAPLIYGHGPINENLQVADVPQVASIEKYLLRFNGNPSRFAVYAQSWSACHGDSGGPIVIDKMGVPTVIGIVNAAPFNQFSGRVNCGSLDFFTGLYQVTATLLSSHLDLMDLAFEEMNKQDNQVRLDMKEITENAIASKEQPKLDFQLTGKNAYLEVWLAGRTDLGFQVQYKAKKGKWKSLGNFPKDGSTLYQDYYFRIKVPMPKDATSIRVREIATLLYSNASLIR